MSVERGTPAALASCVRLLCLVLVAATACQCPPPVGPMAAQLRRAIACLELQRPSWRRARALREARRTLRNLPPENDGRPGSSMAEIDAITGAVELRRLDAALRETEDALSRQLAELEQIAVSRAHHLRTQALALRDDDQPRRDLLPRSRAFALRALGAPEATTIAPDESSMLTESLAGVGMARRTRDVRDRLVRVQRERAEIATRLGLHVQASALGKPVASSAHERVPRDSEEQRCFPGGRTSPWRSLVCRRRPGSS